MSIVLPINKIPATRKEPKLLFLYSLPKVGKTEALSQLDSCLILDIEHRTEEFDATALVVEDLKHLNAIGEQVKKENKPYKRIAVDTATMLEVWAEEFATMKYKKSALGKNFTGETVIELAKGSGYPWLWRSYTQWIGYIRTLADQIILTGHVKEAEFEERKGTDERGFFKIEETSFRTISAADIDLTGKLKRITCAAADAIGFMFRKTKEKGLTDTVVTFKNSGEVLCGSPYKHLNDKTLTFGVSSLDEDGEVSVKFDWSLIYPSLRLEN